MRPVSSPSLERGEKNRNEGSAVLTNYIVNKINRKNKNSKGSEDEGWSVPRRLLFPPRRNEYTCLFYSVEFDSLQQITASRLKKENRVSRAETFLSFFSPPPLFFFPLFFGRKDRSSVQFLVSRRLLLLLQLYAHVQDIRSMIKSQSIDRIVD